MAGGNPIQSLDELPQAVRDFVLSENFVKKLRGIVTNFGLSKQAQEKISNVHYSAVMQEQTFAEVIKTVQKIATDERKSLNDLQIAVIRDLFLPISSYFNDEPKRLLEKSLAPPVVTREPLPRPREQSGLAKMTPVTEKAVVREPLSRPVEQQVTSDKKQEAAAPKDPRAQKIADAVIAEIGLGDKNLESKLREIIIARVAGNKDDLETKAMLKRSANTGGVGLEDSLADTLLGLMKEKAGAMPRPTFSTEKVVGGQAKIEQQRIASPIKERIADFKKEIRLVSPATEPAGERVKSLAGFVVPKTPPATSPKLTIDGPKKDTVASHKKILRPIPVMPIKAQPALEKLEKDEAQELAKVKEKLVVAPQSAVNSDQLVNEIFAAIKINFESEIQKTRLTNAIKNRIRGIRDQFETQELLMRSENLGGVGLNSDVASSVVQIIERAVSSYEQQQIFRKKEELHVVDATLRDQEKEKKQKNEEQKMTEQNERYRTLIKEKAIGGASGQPLGFLKKKAMPTIEVPETTASGKSIPSPRPKMEDIKFAPSLTGPIEELKNFTLNDWQALGAKKGMISQKLAVLRNESYEKYRLAVEAFKTSPLFVMAQELLIESLEKNMPLSGVIALHKAGQKPYLSEIEINDILSIE